MGSYISIQFNKEKLKAVLNTLCDEINGISKKTIMCLKKNPEYIKYIYDDISDNVPYYLCTIYAYFYSLEHVRKNTFRVNKDKFEIANKYQGSKICNAMRIDGTLPDIKQF
jgi:hypothetical protein